MQEQKDHCKFSASLVNRARLCLSKKKKAHMWGCLAGGDVYIIYEPHDITFGAMKKPYQYRMTLHVSISFQRVCYTLVPFKIQFWSTQNVYFSLNGQNTSCLGTVYIRYISYMTLLLFLILFFSNSIHSAIQQSSASSFKYWNYRHDNVSSSQIHLSINTILYIIKPFLKTTFFKC